MIKEQMKIGPKGQVVIPKIFRRSMGMSPGSTVVFKLKKDGILIEKSSENVAAIFDKIAKSGKRAKIEIGESYKEEIEHRWKKTRKFAK